MTARHFLPWNSSPLELAADWIATELGLDQSDAVIALPGARAGRLLRERLAERLGPTWSPPRFVTAGTLTDALLTLDVPAAGRVARTLAWVQALQSLAPRALERIVAAPPANDDLRAWTRLASEVRALFGELAAEGKSFDDVTQEPALQAASGGERARWASLASAQVKMEAVLAREKLADPHLARLAALEAGRVDVETRVVLVGVVEINGLTRRLLEQRDADCLVFAPDELAGHFDALGCVIAERWEGHHTALPIDAWHVVEQPVQQAEQAIACLASFGEGAYRPEQITIGVAQSSVTPYLRRQLGANGIVARDATGTPVMDTAPARFLSELVTHLARPDYQSFATLLRHDDIERVLRSSDELAAVVPARSADAYHLQHVPHLIDGTWPADDSDRRDRKLRDEVAALHRALAKLLRPLAGSAKRPVGDWAGALRDVFGSMYGGRELDPDTSEAQRLLVAGLAAIGKALAELESEVPASFAPRVTATDASRLLLDILGSVVVPPRPVQADEATVDLLGWLELPLDNAPVLVVTGFNEGCVPESRQGDPWLPDSMRKSLGLADNAQRMARDLYTVDLLVHSRERVAFISGRRSVEGDPSMPSRIAYHRPAVEVPARVQHAQQKHAPQVPGGAAVMGSGSAPFAAGLGEEPAKWSASAFKHYIDSPYLFWLERIAGKKTLGDGVRELDALRFGNLAHGVLEDFGRSDLRNSRDPEAIASYLSDRVDLHATRRFGRGTFPAVTIQLHQLKYRLKRFAEVQANWVVEGWRIKHVEWQPSEPVELSIPGGPAITLAGKIDRIDQNFDGRWAIIDYKTGEKGNTPSTARKRTGEWRDLQLPIYSHLARAIVGADELELVYMALSQDRSVIKFNEAKWSQDVVAEALDVARNIVTEVRSLLASGEPFLHGGGKVWEPIHVAMIGEQLVGAGVDE